MSIADAAATDDRLATLKAVRDRLANELDNALPMNVAALAGRLQSVLEEIAALEPKESGDLLDELAERRQSSRGATSKRSASAARQRRPVRSG